MQDLVAVDAIVNISGAWYLPDMDSSVFLRHFREKVTWPEADNICKQHHGTLATGKCYAYLPRIFYSGFK
ncbi:hypothetical protein J437_LFUL017619 [Ladona fulva]|uniref:C-type lectin domain-containing protein n=1 Tax=Ladona fulva TaxID=123851 RepID=A0A8K0KMA3_LADFU|nr:hypothetical protein J437_LFUL017619 [Ladona fulva]